ncbi:hypothetical protein Q3A66_01725 [Hymenobacter sp. BT770]|uniref:hypothetical protein n=1 Tax=Hymenobacter sp. BT770 TaxID=2886942 RepID=UPI001D126069|nr:hypothetical protein [Hymenobacter sp. BT770]MCC3151652.1 hypothetical protein [Hymenobacter sp. BT770]MDO3413771.1 hypothetical protein [Hymenobacter sp. BT770]
MKTLYSFIAAICSLLLLSAGTPGGAIRQPQGARYKYGHYTLANGTRRAGQLRCFLAHDDQLTKLEIEHKKGEMTQVLGPAELRSAVIGTDSMITIRLAEIEDTLKNKPFVDLAHVVMVGKATLLMRRELVKNGPGMMNTGANGMMMPTGGGDTELARWAYQKAGASRSYLLPLDDEEFKKLVAPLFIDFPHLCQRIRDGDASQNDIKRIFYAYNLKADVNEVSSEQAEAACRFLVWK